MNDVKYADKTVEELEKRIAEVYAQAEKEIQEKLDNHLAKFAEKDEKKRTQLKAGEITKGEYTSWRQGQIATGKRWADLRDEMAKDLTNADILAMSISKGVLPDVFAHSHNYGTYQIESQGANTSYTLYDKSTVMRLISENPKLLPDPKVDIPKDLRWNKQHISNVVTQGILQGESIPNLSKRLQRVTEMDKNSAMRNARTMVTSAQNAGRLESMKRAEDMGIPLLKQWLSAHDKRVRKSHQFLDGQEVPVREEFSNGLMYPADPDGDPEEVYNCRCTLLSDVDVENLEESFASDIHKGIDYDEWEDECPKVYDDVKPEVYDKLTKESAYETWFEYEYADAMSEYIRTGKLPKSSYDREFSTDEIDTLKTTAQYIQNTGVTNNTGYKTLYRGMVLSEEDAHALFVVGDTYTMDTLTATATSKDIATIYTNVENAGGEGVPVIIEIQKPDGIKGFHSPDSAEVVLPKGSNWSVTRNFMDENGVVHISLYHKKGDEING